METIMETKLNMISDIFSPEELERYQLTVFPFNIKLLRDKLDDKLNEDPDYEVFIPVYYQKLETNLKEIYTSVLTPYKWFVSNTGRILSKRQNDDGKFLKTFIGSGGYVEISTSFDKRYASMAIHRMLGCAFIPIPEHLKQYHPKELEVNHIDGDKTNYALSNLEWITRLENINHAISTGLSLSGKEHPETKPVKGTVVRGKYKGYQFVLFGGSEVEKYGFDQAAVSNAVSGNLLTHGNCSFTFATEEECATLPRGLTQEIKDNLKSILPNAKFIIVGINIITGERIEAIGDKALKEMGFLPSGVRNCLSGLTKTHKGYTWSKEEIKD